MSAPVLREFDFSTALPYRPFPWLGDGIHEEETGHESLRRSLFHRLGVDVLVGSFCTGDQNVH